MTLARLRGLRRWRGLRALALWLVFGLAAGGASAAPRPLVVHFFDVGQGDAALIVSPAGKTVLVDGGPPEAGPELARRVKQLVKGPLDLVVLTHAHLDHLGGLAEVIRAVGARRYMDPGFAHPSESYENLLDVIGERVPQVVKPEADKDRPLRLLTVDLGLGATLTFLWPRTPVEPYFENTRSDPNANSIVMRLTYGRTAFLFTGDAEEETERRLLQAPRLLRADILKVAHHGSRYSSTAPFVAAVRPKFAIVSSGAGNDFGHPSTLTLERLHDAGAKVVRTDRDGDVRVTSDGRRVRPWSDPRRGKVPAFAASKRAAVFHRINCPAVKQLPASQRVTYVSREEALARREPAEDCRP